MLKNIFSNRLFMGALAFFVLCVGGSLLYMQHVRHQDAEKLAETQDRVEQWNERQNPTTQVKTGDTSQGSEPHETPQRDTTAAEKEIELYPKLTKAEYARLKALNKDLESNIAERQTLRAEMEKAGREKDEVYNRINALFDTPQRTAKEEAEIIALLNRAEELKAVVKRTFKKCEDLATTADTFVAEMNEYLKR